VLMLEYQTARSMSELLEDLFPDTAPDQARARQKMISKAVTDLRQALGWKNSILEQNSVYTLDPDGIWQYDVQEARVAGETVAVFMTGVDADWVLERLRDFNHQPRRLN
jgi:hypothetical protein